jgi:hypothetical protein
MSSANSAVGRGDPLDASQDMRKRIAGCRRISSRRRRTGREGFALGYATQAGDRVTTVRHHHCLLWTIDFMYSLVEFSHTYPHIHNASTAFSDDIDGAKYWQDG